MFSLCGSPVSCKTETEKGYFQGHSVLHDILSDITSSPLKCYSGITVSWFKIPVPSHEQK